MPAYRQIYEVSAVAIVQRKAASLHQAGNNMPLRLEKHLVTCRACAGNFVSRPWPMRMHAYKAFLSGITKPLRSAMASRLAK